MSHCSPCLTVTPLSPTSHGCGPVTAVLESPLTSQVLGVPRHSIHQYYRFIRDVCSWKLLQDHELFKLSGEGHVVQVDESVITKRKYNVGRIVKQQWVLGSYDATIKLGVIMYIPNRSGLVLIQQITKFVQVGSEVWTDCWRGYSSMSTLEGVSPFMHKTVNHRKEFCGPWNMHQHGGRPMGETQTILSEIGSVVFQDDARTHWWVHVGTIIW